MWLFFFFFSTVQKVDQWFCKFQLSGFYTSVMQIFTSYSCCCLLCEESVFFLLQVLQLSLVFSLQLIDYLLMGLLHCCKAPLARGL